MNGLNTSGASGQVGKSRIPWDGQWVPLPVDVVGNDVLLSSDVRVWAAFSRRMNRSTYEVRGVSQAQIAAESGVSERTVSRSVGRLVAAGLLSVRGECNGYGRAGWCVYTLSQTAPFADSQAGDKVAYPYAISSDNILDSDSDHKGGGEVHQNNFSAFGAWLAENGVENAGAVCRLQDLPGRLGTDDAGARAWWQRLVAHFDQRGYADPVAGACAHVRGLIDSGESLYIPESPAPPPAPAPPERAASGRAGGGAGAGRAAVGYIDFDQYRDRPGFVVGDDDDGLEDGPAVGPEGPAVGPEVGPAPPPSVNPALVAQVWQAILGHFRTLLPVYEFARLFAGTRLVATDRPGVWVVVCANRDQLGELAAYCGQIAALFRSSVKIELRL